MKALFVRPAAATSIAAAATSIAAAAISFAAAARRHAVDSVAAAAAAAGQRPYIPHEKPRESLTPYAEWLGSAPQAERALALQQVGLCHVSLCQNGRQPDCNTHVHH